LSDLGFSEAEIKAIAKEYTFMAEPDDEGEVLERTGLPFDYFPSPYANEKAAAAMNNGAAPPDLSLMTKARVGGPDYLYSLLTAYRDPTEADLAALAAANIELGDTTYFNPIMGGNQLAMAPPLDDGLVEYAEGQPEATLEQMAHDVTVFLTWAAEPKMEERKEMGRNVMAFLVSSSAASCSSPIAALQSVFWVTRVSATLIGLGVDSRPRGFLLPEGFRRGVGDDRKIGFGHLFSRLPWSWWGWSLIGQSSQGGNCYAHCSSWIGAPSSSNS
jgi:hypothetical protein